MDSKLFKIPNYRAASDTTDTSNEHGAGLIKDGENLLSTCNSSESLLIQVRTSWEDTVCV